MRGSFGVSGPSRTLAHSGETLGNVDVAALKVKALESGLTVSRLV